MACHIRKNDVVKIICGDHRGAQGKVLRINPRKDLVVVEGVNVVFRHVRPSKKNPQGGRIEKEAPIHISNVLPLDNKTGKGTRVQYQLEHEGARVSSKKRVATSGTVLGSVTKASRNA
jgi:large subunit ribosomal protein L24